MLGTPLAWLINNSLNFVMYTQKVSPAKEYDEKPVKSAFDPSGYDKELVDALERDIVQRNPNVKW